MYPSDSRFWQDKIYADIRGRSLERGRQTTVGVIENVDFRAFGRYVLLENGANIIISNAY